jgi:hypothetical protein
MSDKETINDQKINYLISAIADAQELIRFIDAKTAIVITIIGAYFIGIFSILDKIVKYCDKFSGPFWVTLSIFVVFLILSILVTARIIKPTDNPLTNIKLDVEEKKTIPNIPFYLGPNKYKKKWTIFYKNDKSNKLEQDFSGFKNSLKIAKAEDLIDTLSLELLKVSFIRNIKNDLFNKLIIFLLITTVLFFGFYIIFSHEMFFIEQIKQKAC